MKRIICIGNRYAPQDAAGPLVYERLRATPLPPGVAVSDGALGGLDLLGLVEAAERIVFVDATVGWGAPGSIAVLTAAEIERDAPEMYDHAAGLPYLLRAWRRVAAGPLPEVVLVGIEGSPTRETVEAAAKLCVSIAADGYAPECRETPRLAGVIP